MINKDLDINSVGDVANALKNIRSGEIEEFISWYSHELCQIVKPGNYVKSYKTETGEKIFVCSNCKSALSCDEAGWHYCNHCLAPFDCCGREDEPCEHCLEGK